MIIFLGLKWSIKRRKISPKASFIIQHLLNSQMQTSNTVE